MAKTWAKAWIAAAAMVAALLGPASAQQAQQQDPFNGQFGSMSIAFPPREAVHQAQLMNDALAALQPQRPGQQDVYLIVASLWGQPVFENEAREAEAILRAHFHADGRSILLSAGTGAPVRTYPSASAENLSAAIGKVGQLIGPEDLVVVFITSHGSHDGSAAMLEPDRSAGALRPANLRDAFFDAGIHNRLVIISACFSGAFIAPLMDDDTAVITAAAPDRSSFGCQPENEWTFFGDAYFNHAMRSGAGAIASFDQAKTLITQWEHDQNLSPPSNPQRFVGPHAAQMIAQAEHATPAH